tara:strand:+ start:926 stop:1138 length:213 start_codon:yes stop_codon:yes gene_type:complete
MENMANQLVEDWNDLKVLVDSLELDVHKHANGNASAGIRARRGLRRLKAEASSLVKLSLEMDKTRKASKS